MHSSPQAFQKYREAKIGTWETNVKACGLIFQDGGSRKPNYIKKFIYHFTRTILLLKSLTTSDIDRFFVYAIYIKTVNTE
jgi:hypothetical protein